MCVEDLRPQQCGSPQNLKAAGKAGGTIPGNVLIKEHGVEALLAEGSKGRNLLKGPGEVGTAASRVSLHPRGKCAIHIADLSLS